MAVPKLAELRRNLIRARDELLLGYGDAPLGIGNFSRGRESTLCCSRRGNSTARGRRRRLRRAREKEAGRMGMV